MGNVTHVAVDEVRHGQRTCERTSVLIGLDILVVLTVLGGRIVKELVEAFAEVLPFGVLGLVEFVT